MRARCQTVRNDELGVGGVEDASSELSEERDAPGEYVTLIIWKLLDCREVDRVMGPQPSSYNNNVI